MYSLLQALKMFSQSKAGLYSVLASPVPFAAMLEQQGIQGLTAHSALACTSIGLFLLAVLAPKAKRLILSLLNVFIIACVLAAINYGLNSFDISATDIITDLNENIFSVELLSVLGPISTIVTLGLIVAIIGPFITLRSLPTKWLLKM